MTARSALAAALAGLAWVAWGAFEASATAVYGDDFDSAADLANMALFDAALAATAVVLMGMLAAHRRALGRIGRSAAAVAVAGGTWLAVFATLDAAIPHTAALEAVATGGMIGFWLGGTVFAVALARARVVARWVGPALTLAMVTFPPLAEVGGSVLLGGVMLGLWVAERQRVPADALPVRAGA